MSLPLPAPVREFPFVFWTEVRFRDLDTLAHVNNAVYSTYIESARIAYYQELTGLPLEQLDMILAEITVSFRAPAFYGDRLAIGVRVASIGTKSFTMEYLIARAGDDAVIVTGRSVLVAYDYAAGRTAPVSEAFRRAVAARQSGRDPEHPGEQGEGV